MFKSWVELSQQSPPSCDSGYASLHTSPKQAEQYDIIDHHPKWTYAPSEALLRITRGVEDEIANASMYSWRITREKVTRKPSPVGYLRLDVWFFFE